MKGKGTCLKKGSKNYYTNKCNIMDEHILRVYPSYPCLLAKYEKTVIK